jgi:hypothetical protein
MVPYMALAFCTHVMDKNVCCGEVQTYHMEVSAEDATCEVWAHAMAAGLKKDYPQYVFVRIGCVKSWEEPS